MFFHPNQWEFKCLVHVNIKQNISPSGSPGVNSLSADFITHLCEAPHDFRIRWDEGKKERQSAVEVGNFAHMLFGDFCNCLWKLSACTRDLGQRVTNRVHPRRTEEQKGLQIWQMGGQL